MVPSMSTEGENDGVADRYARLLEKSGQQAQLVRLMEEQLAGLRGLIEECTGENRRLVGVLKEKEEKESELLRQIEEAKKQAEENRLERQRAGEERAVHEQIVKRLNMKLSVRLGAATRHRNTKRFSGTPRRARRRTGRNTTSACLNSGSERARDWRSSSSVCAATWSGRTWIFSVTSTLSPVIAPPAPT